MKNILAKNLDFSIISDDILIDLELRSELYNRCVKIPNGEYTTFNNNKSNLISFQNLRMLETLVTNSMYLKWLNKININNYAGGTYQFINHINKNFDNHIIYNDELKKYEVHKDYEDYPVRGVTWYGAIMFATSCGGRLPTELEWEICAKAGLAENTYPWGNVLPNSRLANYGNVVGNTNHVKEYAPNLWGLYDMAGNIREWCFDMYHPDFYFYNNSINSMPTESEYRVVKGGAWDKTESHLKCSSRAGKWGRIGTMGIGFRIVFSGSDDNFKWE